MSGLAGAIAVGYEIYPVVNREAGGGLPERAYFLLGGKEGETTVSTIRSRINHSQDDLQPGLVDADLIFAGSEFFVLHIRFCTPEKLEGSLTPIVDKKLISGFSPPTVPPFPHAQDNLECR